MRTRGTWKALEAKGNTLTIEFPFNGASVQVKIEFETKDRCLYNAGEEEILVLTRLGN